ncbi:MAG: 2TM domain-containing protein [Bacteroidia bacterium]|nr:2TM domain-containing protein [Bacteroidia bacterium]NNF30888.1 2TM domain-containing protein [Flavobacteriaceae bacterium]MBT8275406.1 2TM domain-containing protein [Bacteroidia bacterium]NNJ82095.1 2TM domain-containing protein [Flavobacteriaceae bacterium]NNK54501.1 2TM domain-containing protein [Flavobacteriaceae bacterium]
MDFNNQDRENKYLKAKERVEEIKKFYSGLIMYVAFITFLAALNYYTNEWSYMWFLWVAFGWGIGLFFHAAKAFRWNPFLGKDWEERKMKEFMDDEDKNQWK